MPTSAKPLRTRSRGNEDNGGLQHRIRHITSLQVRNLTPFPARDELASALVQPSAQSQITAHGHFSDDLDLTMGKRRGRARSSASISTISWQQSSGNSAQDIMEPSSRKRTMSRASTSTTSSVGVTSTPKARISGTAVSTRPPLRQRTPSTASSTSFGQLSLSCDTTMPPTLSLSGFLHDTSQDTLEDIVQSRLVETFLTLTAISAGKNAHEIALQTSPPGNPPAAVVNGHDDLNLNRRNTIASSSRGSSSRSSTLARGRSPPSASGPSNLKAGPSGHSKSMSVSALPSSKVSLKPSPSKPLSQRPPIPRALAAPKAPVSPFAASAPSDPPPERPIPDYISPILKASTNPRFEIDPRGGFEFAPDTDLGASKMTVEICGRLSSNLKGKGKGKQKAQISTSAGMQIGDQDWQVLKTWEVDLNRLVPLTDDLAQHSSRLPSNTLCITLEPFGRTYYLPTPRPSTTLFRRSRSPSPAAGYNSDPESNVRDVEIRTPRVSKKDGTQVHHDPDISSQSDLGPPATSRNSRSKRPRTSASWQSMMKLVSLQAVIQDTERSVTDLGLEIAPFLVGRSTVALNREVSEREAWVHDLQSERASLEDKAETLRKRVLKKREELESRRKMLSIAYEAHSDDLGQESEQKARLQEARTDLMLLGSRIAPIRNELLTSLAFIFPIELLSPPDLLFTILDVPLPIPSGPTDPAPPLTMSSRKEVTEDSVSTALGFAAQLVQLLAGYLGQRLVYPITCVGSRSVVKDGISAMVGPRMFPLFSKGVDTYRFEYGVFLLNKNIEILMSERDLRALDTRHTLPNLKNLLLTLTDPDTIPPRPHRASSIASATVSALQSPVLLPSVLLTEPDNQSNQRLKSVDTLQSLEGPRIEIDSPPASGSNTPTTSAITPTNTIRKSRAFLDLTPLSGFWKSRSTSRSSSRSSVKAEPPLEDDHAGEATPTISFATNNFDQAQTESAGVSGDEEDDRQTIRGGAGEASSDEVPERKVRSNGAQKTLMNGNGVGHSNHATTEKSAAQLHTESHVVDGVS
ncbi:UV radiation resistance protein and autophagy-related subunit 14-domain-containing protein [Cytidiella melzeri]|nr:UV radiation resistance protein and autophagy-related subunit 14-domain-containing protein [Cytidiella melzeri]